MAEQMENGFYKRAANYWAGVPATVNGVLAGYADISDIDIESSKEFLDRILASSDPPDTNLALDCGAGIGRVTKNLLAHYFHKVDLVEQDAKFINAAKQYLGERNDKLGTLYQIGLQHFEPEKKYDVIWCQWVLGHLNDHDFVSFFKRCSKCLAKNGIIFVKENITVGDEVEYDDDDSSVTRPHKLMLKLFDDAELHLIETKIQGGFPDDIFPVYMYNLKPKRKYFGTYIYLED
ncbi:N-terminal Xaa-Pro-Lys N-methyltransferase 1-B-like [Epargyreus clarus]|uniref:N-terminal Xaa-Pro-Lys N-methyltransferase 1-B-like n=1 Tax=Epargyreus clarus TaxID=520877 RepID=UPI003C30B994